MSWTSTETSDKMKKIDLNRGRGEEEIKRILLLEIVHDIGACP